MSASAAELHTITATQPQISAASSILERLQQTALQTAAFAQLDEMDDTGLDAANDSEEDGGSERQLSLGVHQCTARRGQSRHGGQQRAAC